MMTLKELYTQANEIVELAFPMCVIHNVSSTALLTKSGNGDLHIGLSYFVSFYGRNYFGDVQGNNVDSVLEKLKLKCELEKANFVIFADKQEDIVL